MARHNEAIDYLRAFIIVLVLMHHSIIAYAPYASFNAVHFLWAAPIVDLIGAKIAFYDTLPAPNVGKVESDGKSYDWDSWAEILQPGEGTQTIAKYADQFYAGSPAAVTRALGRGTVTYIGVDSANGDLEYKLLGDVFARAGVKTTSYDDGFVVDWRDGFWVATNFTEKNLPAPAPDGAKLLIGTRELPPAGVAVWQQ